MKFMRQTHKTRLSLNYKEPFVYQKIGLFIFEWMPYQSEEIVIVCIGSDRATGDALGPLTGSMLIKHKHSKYSVYGTLEEPIHALNLKQQIKQIKKQHPNAFIIAIDACLGRASSVGHITASIGALKPGLALKKDLPKVGDFHVTGIVNVNTPIDFLALQNTRLFLVMEQAETIARAFNYAEYLHSNHKRAKQ